MRDWGSLTGYLSHTKALWVMTVGVLLANIALYSIVTSRTSSQVRALEDAFQEKRKEIRLGAHSGEAAWDQGRKDIEKFEALLPRQKDVSRIVKGIFADAQGAGLRIRRVSYAPEKVEGGLLLYSISFPVRGSYPMVKKFLYNLESSRMMVIIEDLLITHVEGETVELSVRLSTYFTIQG